MSNHNPKSDRTVATGQSPAMTCRPAKAALVLGAGAWVVFFSGLALMVRFYRPGRPGRSNPNELYFELFEACIIVASVGAAIAAIATGFQAGRRIRANPALAGKLNARTGAILGSLYLIWLSTSIIPGLMPARTTSSKNACINSLRQIDGAKEQWALEYKKTATDTPTWKDLVGSDKYIRQKLVCNKQGTLSINSMSLKPTCSIIGHTLQ